MVVKFNGDSGLYIIDFLDVVEMLFRYLGVDTHRTAKLVKYDVIPVGTYLDALPIGNIMEVGGHYL